MARHWFVHTTLFLLSSAVSLPALAEDIVAEPRDEATFVFDQGKVQTYEITVSKSDLAKIDAKPSAEEWVRGSLKFNGKTYSPVGIRYKGSVGAFLSPCTGASSPGIPPGKKLGKCSIKIGFDKYDASLRFYGLKTLNLHAMGRDETLIHERLGYAMYREMGVAAPRAMHARVEVNGALEGLFVAVEQADEVFTASRFVEGGKGNLYKEVWPMYGDAETYAKALETNKDRADVDKMLGFKRAVDSGASAVTDKWIDRDYTLRYLVVDRLTINDDGIMHWYCGAANGNNRGAYGNHNYYWYESSERDRQFLVPWDLTSNFKENETDFVHIQRPWFEPTNACTCGIDLLNLSFSMQRAAYCDPLIKIMASWKSEYDAMVTKFVTGPFAAKNVDAKLKAWEAQIRDVVAEESDLDQRLDFDSWEDGMDDLRRIISEARIHGGYWY
ncbi:MAG: CotH kinase family protein [Polyangiales bacterium]